MQKLEITFKWEMPGTDRTPVYRTDIRYFDPSKEAGDKYQLGSDGWRGYGHYHGTIVKIVRIIDLF